MYTINKFYAKCLQLEAEIFLLIFPDSHQNYVEWLPFCLFTLKGSGLADSSPVISLVCDQYLLSE